MILGVGTDLIEVARIKRAIQRHGSRFVERVFTHIERAYCDARKWPERYYAARFAAKEAVLKALGTGWMGGIAWTDIEVDHAPAGNPIANLTGEAGKMMKKMGGTRLALSITHTDNHASAVAILEGSPPTGV